MVGGGGRSLVRTRLYTIPDLQGKYREFFKIWPSERWQTVRNAKISRVFRPIP